MLYISSCSTFCICLKSILIYRYQPEFAIWSICNASQIKRIKRIVNSVWHRYINTGWCLKLVLIYRWQTEFNIWSICNIFLLTHVSSWYWYIDAKQNLPFGQFVVIFNYSVTDVSSRYWLFGEFVMLILLTDISSLYWYIDAKQN